MTIILKSVLGESWNSRSFSATFRGQSVVVKQVSLIDHDHYISVQSFYDAIQKNKSESLLKIIHHQLQQDESDQYIYLVLTEVCQFSLKSVFGKKKNLFQLVDLAQRTAQTLSQLHNKKIYHKNLKSSNVMIKNGQIRLSDISRRVQYQPFQAPQLQKDKIGSSADLFSLGVIMFELFSGKAVSSFLCDKQKLYQKKGFPQFLTSEIPCPELACLVQRQLSINPKERLQASEVATLLSRFNVGICLNNVQELLKSLSKHQEKVQIGRQITGQEKSKFCADFYLEDKQLEQVSLHQIDWNGGVRAGVSIRLGLVLLECGWNGLGIVGIKQLVLKGFSNLVSLFLR